ncbi:sensor histidine kinase [Saccharicrinis fermentans]|uniref:Putative sensor-like histidine kinase YehU n=1 Tax=Saccharicrinis fermentans DSM 9555 = JCM 21142 TaxID=869213 RepID=W7YDF1_9BACT|nr:histidine kinase [Saccharicrinis fermentans]GAF02516.1 putative sensor-like histidine kinase YehU [Saccharicrinis fermentans DSM 9555 = JCM 21142]
MIANRRKILFIPFITILIMATSVLLMIFFGYRSVEEVKSVLFYRMGMAFLNAIITVTLFYLAVNWFNKKIDWKHKWGLRLLLDAGLILFQSFIGIAAISYLKAHIVGNQAIIKEFMYVIPLLINSLFLVLIELIMGMEERNKLALQVANLEKEQINAKYGALKAQLDHHFLFNNLSVLSSIIYEDVHKADKFIQRFSQVYRYVLSINKRDLVSLEEEIAFIKSYLQLYKFRFEDGFNYEINIEQAKNKMLIAPLTLQVLVENAIKHNVVSRCQPLCIRVFNEDDVLVVRNNLQIRDKSDVESTYTGHRNIIEKYELLNQRAPVFCKREGSYTVKITLIPPLDD